MYNDYYGYTKQYLLVHETEKAYLVRDDVGEFWIPKSLTKNIATRDNQIRFARLAKFRPDYLLEHDTDFDEAMEPLEVEKEVEEPDFDVLDMKKLKKKKKKKKGKVLYDTEWARNEGLL